MRLDLFALPLVNAQKLNIEQQYHTRKCLITNNHSAITMYLPQKNVMTKPENKIINHIHQNMPFRITKRTTRNNKAIHYSYLNGSYYLN